MADHPYQSLPDYCYWRRSIAGVPTADVDPVIRAKFRIKRSDLIATAGSCFAQHISRHLVQAGFSYLVTESAHPVVAHLAYDYGYGLFTARYGNIYTSRQLLQTVQRAYGLFTPQDDVWPSGDGRVIDPYRPQIQPNGFSCLSELVEDRKRHLAAVRRAIEELDVFVFTLGLTETWINRADGAAYPLCPGVAGGVFDADRHAFVNLSVSDVIADMTQAIELIRSKTAKARFVLTVSPVPLIATMEDRSVLVSTTYSKSVLRVAAEEIASRHDAVAYFPSYEIITGNHARGAYFADELRDVTEEGVSHVMRLFLQHYADGVEATAAPPAAVRDERRELAERVKRDLAEVVAVMCDEVALDPFATPKGGDLALVPAPETPAARQSQPAATTAMDYLMGIAATPPPSQTSPARQEIPRPRGLFSRLTRRSRG